MTDAHTHIVRGGARHFLCEPFSHEEGAMPRSGRPGTVFFFGCHPWDAARFDGEALRAKLAADPRAGVGETGLDRLKDRTIGEDQRSAFAAQLRLAAEFRRPVALHGASVVGFPGRFVGHRGDALQDEALSAHPAINGAVHSKQALQGFLVIGPVARGAVGQLVIRRPDGDIYIQFSSVHSLSRVRLFATP